MLTLPFSNEIKTRGGEIASAQTAHVKQSLPEVLPCC